MPCNSATPTTLQLHNLLMHLNPRTHISERRAFGQSIRIPRIKLSSRPTLTTEQQCPINIILKETGKSQEVEVWSKLIQIFMVLYKKGKYRTAFYQSRSVNTKSEEDWLVTNDKIPGWLHGQAWHGRCHFPARHGWGRSLLSPNTQQQTGFQKRKLDSWQPYLIHQETNFNT